MKNKINNFEVISTFLWFKSCNKYKIVSRGFRFSPI